MLFRQAGPLLSVVAHTDLLTCCVDSAALRSGPQTAILPVQLRHEASPVAMVWRRASVEAQRAMARLDGLPLMRAA